MKKLNNKVINKDQYNYEKDLNFHDNVLKNEIEDPSINDFLKGYQIDPYEFRHWANARGLKKISWKEIDVLEFNPKYLSDKILKLWNASDGLLQNVYESFTLRYDNNLKKAIADELEKSGYKVYPLLIDDLPRYAKHKMFLYKIAKNRRNILNYAKILNNRVKSNGLKNLIAEVEDANVVNLDVLSDYYKLIYPEDYAIQLINDLTNNNINNAEMTLSHYYNDFSLTDQSLSQIEKMLNGQSDPLYINDGGVGGYDFTSNMRNDTTMPQLYEASKKKELK